MKRNTADAHPLVGACNTPQQLRHTLELAGYRDVEIRTTNHLASAWSRHMPTHYLGLLGDWLASPFPSRRSTITARARKPA